jgi:hypothetical protein
MAKPPKKIKIVYFDECYSATKFSRQADAEAAAVTVQPTEKLWMRGLLLRQRTSAQE